MSLALASALIFSASYTYSFAFPVDDLFVTDSQFDSLNTTGNHDELATSLILPHIKALFNGTAASLLVEPGDIVIKSKYPDVTIDDSCDHKIEALNGHSDGEVKNSTYMQAGVKLSWKAISVFVDAELDAVLDIGGDVRVRVGKHVFGHHCTQLARKTMGLDIKSDGKTGVGINMTASNARLSYDHDHGTWQLVFNFHADVVGKVIQWNVDRITADGCKIKVLDMEVASVCGYVERHVQSKVQTLLNQVTRVDAPAILKRLEEKINTAVGAVVKVPLKIPSGLSKPPWEDRIVV